MLITIILITFISIIILMIGFFEIRIPYLFDDLFATFNSSHKKLKKHTRKMLRKRMWNNQMHKGFVKLPT